MGWTGATTSGLGDLNSPARRGGVMRPVYTGISIMGRRNVWKRAVTATGSGGHLVLLLLAGTLTLWIFVRGGSVLDGRGLCGVVVLVVCSGIVSDVERRALT
ncbi:hypothetical protein V8D89_012231 [Ganoderma adspersum]